MLVLGRTSRLEHHDLGFFSVLLCFVFFSIRSRQKTSDVKFKIYLQRNDLEFYLLC